MLPLQGMKVLDLTQFLAGPYCTMVLADMGAEVTKVEKFPQGDDSRRLGPFINGEGYCFAMPNRNKKSLALNLKSAKGREIFLKLAKEADVVIENFRPGVTQKLGIDYEQVAKVNPGIIYCSISGFGQYGPYSHKGGFDIIAQGFTGFMRMTGEPDGRPVKVGIAINDIAAGATAIYGILGAYIHKMKTGEGQYLDTSLVDAGLAWTVWESAAYFGAGEIPEPTGTRHRRSTPYQAYKTKDGFVTIGAGNQRLWERLCQQVLKRPEWIEDPRFIDLATRMENIDILEQEIEHILRQETTSYWVQKLDEAGIPGGPVYTYDQALNDPHVEAREMVVELDHPKLGRIKTIGIPIKFSKTPLAIREPAPLLGQHTTEKLKEIGLSEEEIERLYQEEVVYAKYGEYVKEEKS
ncbi:crotonobetainyl-CoA:carnitine CoA-transferase CaiB-like acyl-CoA transferase [Caldalkalibacillus uzonensis]|uniref:Crotonobetainyl-CoA:carnitine CoA-transferase CaiB-like acyl-CoA transferase n=1 Tax=Caldalkalibacillus uzonensis TaxID=353224 RepID=A0ABU0CPM5_9BACI|nr:CoA transferase [Caldalkalibacillus uzonensis]MDQ0338097.1 crotonobetainyl-CoA:carnitine CoA-transferase CaiB-like acyl-CoA transferase [Caldalkalibacillus uzonensis]